MQTAATIERTEASRTETLSQRKRRNAREKLELCREAIADVVTSEKESWVVIMKELADGGFTDAELESELAASRNTLYKWKTGAAAPREMTRRLLQKAILEMIDQRLERLED